MQLLIAGDGWTGAGTENESSMEAELRESVTG
jgi:hypothetical protein